jgi:hypothetical protein
MSTPSGKPGNPIDLSAYEPRRARERVAAAPHPSEDKTDRLRSPYAPKRAHEPAGTGRQPVENGRDPLRSRYAPMKSRGQPAVAPDFGINSDAELPPPMRVREGSRERPTAERHTLGGGDHSPNTALEEGIRGRQPVTAASFQPIHPSSGRYQPAPERRDEIMSDHDLKRLEASLRWLQHQEAARLTRAAPLLPVPGLASAHTTGHHHNSEMPVDSLQAPRSLEPERLAPPFAMSPRRYNLRWPLGIVVASIFAAAIAYYFSVGSWSPKPGPQIGSLDQTIPAPQSTGAQKSRPSSAQHSDPETAPVEMSSEHTGISQTTRSSESETAPMLQAEAPPPRKFIRALDPEQIKLLTRQGEQLAATGDLVTARILFQRAAEVGDATAAMALGATYDPNVLAKLGVAGMAADVEKARSWYRKAESFGSAEASRRLRSRLDGL